MANKPLDTTLLDRAIMFAVKAHAGTVRDSHISYTRWRQLPLYPP